MAGKSGRVGSCIVVLKNWSKASWKRAQVGVEDLEYMYTERG